MGQAHSAPIPYQASRIFLNINPDLNVLYEKIEDFSPPSSSNEDEICKTIFRDTFSCQSDGRYVVAFRLKVIHPLWEIPLLSPKIGYCP